MIRRLTLSLISALVFVAAVFSVTSSRINAQTQFLFASISDSQNGSAALTRVLNQIKTLNPAFMIINGDFEDDGGPTDAELTPKVNALKSAGLFEKSFAVRGNHDADQSASTWQTLFTGYFGGTTSRALPSGVTNYVPMSSSTSYMNYSFDYGNSRLVGIDVPGCPDLINSEQYTFLENRVSNAESLGLTHVFLFWHGPEYYMEDTHDCSFPSTLLLFINRHPIISATFHGHSHILGWTVLNGTRVPGLTHEYEQFMTSPAGGYLSYYGNLVAGRMDYAYALGTGENDMGFGTLSVNGNSFTFSLYKLGDANPVRSETFSKTGGGQTTAPTATPAPTKTPVATVKPTATPVKTPTPGPTNTPPPGTGSLQYYGVDRVLSNADFAKLAAWGINTAVVAISTSSTSSWQSVYDAAHNAGVNIIIWPLDAGGDNNCGWESPFNAPANGNYITKVTNMLTWWANKPGVVGIVTFHEPMWSTSSGCKDSIADLSAIYQQIHSFTGNPNFRVFGYINTLNASTIKNGEGGGTGIADYTGPADLAKIMDVAVIWRHCAGGIEGPCEGSDSTISRINESRTILGSINSSVKLLFLQQTFTSDGYGTKFTLNQLQDYSCKFLNTGALDGFAYYTWDSGWYKGDLHTWTDLQPAVKYVHDNCISSLGPTAPPVPQGKPGDANGDGVVNDTDYNAPYWVSHYGQTIGGGPGVGDFNGSGTVDGVDYSIWLTNYGK